MNQAWVVAVDMGYGHQRAAYPFRDIAYERIVTANTDDRVGPKERRLWKSFQGFYEGVSRANNIPVIGPWIWRAYDRLQSIHPHYPFRDLSKPSLGSTRLHRLIQRGFGMSTVEYTRKRDDLPFLTTFYAAALAADQAGRRDVFCVVTDTDINRVWVAEDPSKSRVHYLAPTALSRMRLLQYGVPDERIFVTGFPLPEENVATAGVDLLRRISVLDASGVFRTRYRAILGSAAGMSGGAGDGHGAAAGGAGGTAARLPFPDSRGVPLSVTFAIGGAGAQAKTGAEIVESLAGMLKEGRVRLNLVAGVRSEVRDFFRNVLREQGLESEEGRAVRILYTETKDDYFAAFNILMRETDVLWTKPSELCFYAGLGIPIVMTPPLGAHEERNAEWLTRAGAGLRQEPPRAASEWLSDWIRTGLLAVSAFQGFMHIPATGTENIKRVLFAPDRSRVELAAVPPALGVPPHGSA